MHAVKAWQSATCLFTVRISGFPLILSTSSSSTLNRNINRVDLAIVHAHCTLYSCLQYLPDGSRMKAVSANFSSDIFVMTKTPLIFISFSSPVLIFVLVLVSSTKIRNNFVIFVIVFVVVDEKNTGGTVLVTVVLVFNVNSCCWMVPFSLTLNDANPHFSGSECLWISIS